MQRRVAIAGASGFVGRALEQKLRGTYEVVSLVRAFQNGPETEAVAAKKVRCDLFNARETEEALVGVDTLVYLVHSMLPSARLTQGGFEDFDLLCADNVARAAKKNQIKHIVYLGGLLPRNTAATTLSKHLRSRWEVEKALGSHGTPVTSLRAGMVIGPGGSSFGMMLRLVERLPLMIGPRWTQSKTQCVSLNDAVNIIAYAIEHPSIAGKAYDIGCPEVVSYQEMMVATAGVLNKNLRVLPVPMHSPGISKLWVGLFTGAPSALVGPLVQSLKHDMVATDGLWLQRKAGQTPESFYDVLREAVHAERSKGRHSLSRAKSRHQKYVRSVQRLILPRTKNAAWVADMYARWLPKAMWPWIRVEIDTQRSIRFYLSLFLVRVKILLLELRYASERSTQDRQLFFISKGLLVGKGPHNARLEFREVLDKRFVLAAIHEFHPRLPWFIYKFTQALLHLWVMRSFGRFLRREDERLEMTADNA